MSVNALPAYFKLDSSSSQFHPVPASSMYANSTRLIFQHGLGGACIALVGASLVAVAILTVLTYTGNVSPNILTDVINLATQAELPGLIGLFSGVGVISLLGLYTIYKGLSFIKEAWVFDRPASAIELEWTPDDIAATLNNIAIQKFETDDPYPSGYKYDRNEYIGNEDTNTTNELRNFYKNLAARDMAVATKEMKSRDRRSCCERTCLPVLEFCVDSVLGPCIDSAERCYNRHSSPQ